MWLHGPHGRVSTLDLLGPHFTLLAPAGAGWPAAATETARLTGVPLTVAEISDADVPDTDVPNTGTTGAGASRPPGPLVSPTWAKEYELGPGGAVLVRPDGHVAWRSPGGPASARTLTEALGRILSRR
ncbi:hypothetical protein [Streptosporangium longisporum]|uniref:aromatic-ring hydroxylase C-terminal domain-containing protein n=1 Tax=Streptosporangium longisporum TaxID=46187 RepID=UPI0031E91B5A